jgi:hypothetical protein
LYFKDPSIDIQRVKPEAAKRIRLFAASKATESGFVSKQRVSKAARF